MPAVRDVLDDDLAGVELLGGLAGGVLDVFLNHRVSIST